MVRRSGGRGQRHKRRDYQGIDVRGKVALASGYAANVVREAVLKHGAVGVVIYPAAGDRPDHPDMVRYNGIWPRAEELDKTSGGFQISRNQYDMLKALMKQGAVRVHGKIDATLGPGKLTLVHAYIRGTEHPEREVLITGHLDHPKWSANDNASGSGAMMEAARTLQTLIAAKKLAPPKLTIHFMWVPEYFGTLAYVSNHKELKFCWNFYEPPSPTARQCVLANINMDMVGEDTVKTNSRFYFTRTPDSVPFFINAVMSDVLQQTREADLYAQTGTRNYWQPEAIPYAQGSDHDVFLGSAFRRPCSATIPIGLTTPARTKSTRPTPVSFAASAHSPSAAAWFMATADAQHPGSSMRAGAYADRVAELARRLAQDAATSESAVKRILKNREEFDAQSDHLDSLTPHQERPTTMTQSPCAPAMARTALRFFPSTPPHSKASAQTMANGSPSRKPASPATRKAWPPKPNFRLISFEAVNFMDGRAAQPKSPICSPPNICSISIRPGWTGW